MNRTARTVIALASMSLLSALGGCYGHGEHTREGMSLAKERMNGLKAATQWGMADQQFLAGDLKKAKASVQQSIALNPKVAKSQVLLGRIYLEEGKLEDARLALLKAEEIDKDYVDAQYYLGIVNERFSQWDEAYTRYSRAAELDAANPQYVVAAAEMLIAMNKHEEAKALLTGRSADFQHNAAIRQSLGQIAMLQRDYPKAVEFYSDARRLAPDDVMVLEELVRAQIAAGDYREAEFNLAVLLKADANKNRRDLETLRAQCLMRTGRTNEARAILNRLTAGDEGSRDLNAWVLLGQACAELNDAPRMRMVSARLIALAPERYEGYFLRAAFLKQSGDLAGALKSIDDAIDAAGENPEPVLFKGAMLQQQGRTAEAQEIGRQVLTLYPDNAMAQQLAGTNAQWSQPTVTTAPEAPGR